MILKRENFFHPFPRKPIERPNGAVFDTFGPRWSRGAVPASRESPATDPLRRLANHKAHVCSLWMVLIRAKGTVPEVLRLMERPKNRDFLNRSVWGKY